MLGFTDNCLIIQVFKGTFSVKMGQVSDQMVMKNLRTLTLQGETCEIWFENGEGLVSPLKFLQQTN